jgi:membrane-associated phospholipid phosphatase
MAFIKNRFRDFSIIDWISFLFLIIVTLFYFIAFPTTPYRWEYFVLLIALYLLLFTMSALRPAEGSTSGLKRFLMFLYPVIFLIAVFESFYMILPYFNPNHYDAFMAAADFKLLGVHPTVWIESFIHPVVTEILYFAYILYFPMPLVLAGWMYKKQMFNEISAIFLSFFICYYGAYISYFLIPVQGPRFHLASLQQVPLKGVLLSDTIRDLINMLEPNKLDAFPSLHAAIILLSMIAAKKYNRTLYRIFLPVAILITASLVYLRYHYVIDVVAGFVWAGISWHAGRYLYRRFCGGFSPHFYRKER